MIAPATAALGAATSGRPGRAAIPHGQGRRRLQRRWEAVRGEWFAVVVSPTSTSAAPATTAHPEPAANNSGGVNPDGRRPLAAIQAYGIAIGLEHWGHAVINPGFFFRFSAMITLTGGTILLMWIGEQITSRGVGNGISLIIFAGIVARFPQLIGQALESAREREPRHPPSAYC